MDIRYRCVQKLTEWCCHFRLHDKKENKIFLKYKEIQSGAVAKSYMRKGFLIYEEMRKYFPIYEEAVIVIYDFATAPIWISFYVRKIWFSFLSGGAPVSLTFLFGTKRNAKRSRFPRLERKRIRSPHPTSDSCKKPRAALDVTRYYSVPWITNYKSCTSKFICRTRSAFCRVYVHVFSSFTQVGIS